jgi:hypothetical protein
MLDARAARVQSRTVGGEEVASDEAALRMSEDVHVRAWTRSGDATEQEVQSPGCVPEVAEGIRPVVCSRIVRIRKYVGGLTRVPEPGGNLGDGPRSGGAPRIADATDRDRDVVVGSSIVTRGPE